MAIDEASVVTSPDEPDVSARDVLRRLYALTYSKKIGLGIIIAFAVLVLIGVIVGQAPAGVYEVPEMRAAFVESARARFGGWASVLDVLGFFHVFSSIPFLVVVGALGVSITGCTTHRIPQLWARWRHPKTRATDRFFAGARYRAEINTGVVDDQNIELVVGNLKTKRYRVIRNKDGSVYADKYSWGGFGTVTAHLSFIMILVAFVVSSLTSFEEVLYLPVGGDAVGVGNESSYTLEATSFQATYDDETGRALDYVSHLVLSEAGQVVSEQDVRVNQPLVWHGWKFHQTTYGLGVDVQASSQGESLLTQTVPMQWTTDDGTLSVGEFVLPNLGLTVEVMIAASGVIDAALAPGEAAFRVFREGENTPMAVEVVGQGQSVSIGDLELTFSREREYTGITARRDPGALWMWIGSTLLVIGMTVTFGCRPRALWIRSDDTRITMASSDKEDSGFRAQFNDLVTEAQSWFGKDEE